MRNNMHIRLTGLFLILALLGLMLGACEVLPAVTGGQQPGDQPIPGDPQPQAGEDHLTLANVEEINLQFHESLPMQVAVVASGYLDDNCTTLDRTVKERSGNAFQITIFARRAPNQACAQAVFPFEQVIELDVLGLLAGTYSVDVNGVKSQFVLQADNRPVDERASVSGLVWHDLCALAVDTGGRPVQASDGCARITDTIFEGNGVLEAGEPGIGGVMVNLGLGACSASGFASTLASSDGSFTFADLTPGTYCVSIDPLLGQNPSVLVPGGWTSPARDVDVATNTITLQAGENKSGLNFGWDYQFKPEPPQLPTPTPLPTATPRPIPCDWAQFVSDVTIKDGTVYAPGAKFTKIWRLKNIGTCTWTSGYNLVFASGDQMGAANVVGLAGTVRPGETIDVSVNLIAPTKEGKYRGYWQLRNADGVLFGLGEEAKGRFYVDIEVKKDVALKMVYDFAAEYCNASWESAAGDLPCQGSTDSEIGFVQLLRKPALENRNEDELALWVHPNHNNDSWIRGTFPAFKVKDGDQFRAWVGCLADSEGCDVLFELGYFNEKGSYKKLGQWHEVYEGKVTVINLDLSELAGKKVSFVLTMATENGRPRRADGFWFVPNIKRIASDIS